MELRFLARSRHPLVCSGEEETRTAIAAWQNHRDRRAVANLQSRCSYLEVEAESRLSHWYVHSRKLSGWYVNPNMQAFFSLVTA